ncbi:hypothetical protein [Paucilactobacillus nenjiangensis]|uniref:hypothetical protein n=1 Tax=Paucilactobacillus nenjiangensis TaxID=1296540 RepID=UPI003BB63D62
MYKSNNKLVAENKTLQTENETLQTEHKRLEKNNKDVNDLYETTLQENKDYAAEIEVESLNFQSYKDGAIFFIYHLYTKNPGFRTELMRSAITGLHVPSLSPEFAQETVSKIDQIDTEQQSISPEREIVNE